MKNANAFIAPTVHFGRSQVAGMAAAVLCVIATALLNIGATWANGGTISLDNPTRISRMAVTVNKSETIHFGRAFTEALVAKSELADVTPLTDHALYIIGKKVGQTRVTVLDNDKRLLGVIDVDINYDVASLRKELQRDSHLSNVRVTTANGRIMLTGNVPDAPSQSRALAIARQFVKEDQPTDKGTTPSKEVDIVIDAMTVRASQQVMLEVRFVEVNRTAARDLGVNWASANKHSISATGTSGANSLLTNPFLNATGAAAGLVPLAGIPSGATPFGQAIISVLNSNRGSADLILQALEKRGLTLGPPWGRPL